MSKRTTVLMIVALLLAVGVVGWLFGPSVDSDSHQSSGPNSENQPTPLIASKEADMDGLQLAATQSCKCERSGGSEDGCWKNYDEQKIAIEAMIFGDQAWGQEEAGSATACAPVSTEIECLLFSDGERCVVTGYSANGASMEDSDVMVCTAAEAQAIELAHSDAWTVNGVSVDSGNEVARAEANKRANAAVAEVMKKIRSGQSFEYKRSGGGCV